MTKLAWVLLPIALAAAALAVLWLRGRWPSRLALNIVFSLLLLAYVAATAGLGIFWVANQQLPVFDWHYLFGYAVVGLVVVHLAFNLRVIWTYLRRRSAAQAPAAKRRPLLGAIGWFAIAAAGGLGFYLGLRQGRTELRLVAATPRAGDALAVVEHFHAASSHSRTAAFGRAPSTDWGEAPPPFKPPGGGAVHALPAPGVAPPAAGIDAAALGSVLWHTTGVSLVRGGLHLRTSPSSGALFATELYVVARRVAGVAPGLWHYAPQQHALVRVATGDGDGLDAAIGAAVDAPDATAALIIATAIFRRSGRKYGDRTYRYVLADLGHALENLRVAAAASGIAARFAPRFDEARIAALLRIDETDEGVLAIALLHTDPARDAALATVADWTPPPLVAENQATLGLTEAVHRATSLRRRVEAAAPPPQQPAPADAAPAARPVDAIARPADAAARLAVISRRRSIRRFAATPVALTDLHAVLEAMAEPRAAALSAAVRIHLTTPAVDRLRPGVWRLDGTAALRPSPVPADALRARARAAALDQDVIGDAAVVFVLTADRAAFVADRAGPARGYRHALLEAGRIGERVYLEGGARGLGVCSVGAFYDDEAARLVGIDPAHEWVLHFVALGVPGSPA